MEGKITTIIDNCVYGHILQAEHGLSVYIEKNGYKYLFDTGSSDLFLHNARVLHIDLTEVDYLILSHGHGDHAGGLRAFMRQNQKAKIIVNKGFFDRKFKGDRENGVRHPDELDRSRFLTFDTTTLLHEGIYICPVIHIFNPADTHFSQFVVERGGTRIPDDFIDEQALVIREGNDLTLLSACSHRGITNIIRSIMPQFEGYHLRQVVGGFHIHMAGEEQCNLIAQFFQQYPECRIGVCHCSGVDQFARLYSLLGDRVFYNHIGTTLTV